MKLNKVIFTLALSFLMLCGFSYTANADSSTYYFQPHNVITTKRVKVVKIKNTQTLANSYSVGHWYLKAGKHLHGVHHSASYNWVIGGLNGKYTYVVDEGFGHGWFRKAGHVHKRNNPNGAKHFKLANYYINKFNKEEKITDKYEKMIDKANDNTSDKEYSKLYNQYNSSYKKLNYYYKQAKHYYNLSK